MTTAATSATSYCLRIAAADNAGEERREEETAQERDYTDDGARSTGCGDDRGGADDGDGQSAIWGREREEGEEGKYQSEMPVASRLPARADDWLDGSPS